MRKLFSIFAFVLLYAGITFGQAAIDIPFSASDGSRTQVLLVGLDPTATDGIDPALGESDLPPFPPSGVFEIRYDLAPGAPGLSTYQDYRNAAAFPYTGTIDHILWYQTSAAGLAINIDYNLPTGAVLRITDQIGGGFLNIGPFSGSGTAVIPASYTGIFVRAIFRMEYTNIAPIVLGPTFDIAPASLSFGTVNVGNNATLPVTVSNTGTADLIISGVVSSDAQFTFAPGAFPLTIPVGGNSILNVTFTPAAAGVVNGNLTFTHNAPGSPTVYNLTGTGYVPAPIFGVSPASLNFGSIAVGGSANLNVTVTNTGDAQLVISNIVSSSGVFTFVPNAFPVNIAAGGNSVFVVTFTPTVAGVVNANLTFTHNAAGSPTDYAVTGTGFTTAPLFGFNVPSLGFGNISVGGSATLPVTVSNTGNALLTISGIVSSDAAQYTFAPSAPVNIAAGNSATFNVTFTPAAAGLVNGTLTFTSNAASSPDVLNLSGTGQTQGGTLRFVNASQSLPDGSTNNPDAIVLDGYTGQPMKALQFDVIVGKTNGALILSSIQRGLAVPAPQFNFSYQIYPGPTLPDGSSTDRIKVVIVGNGTNAILPGAVQEIMKFNFDIVDITGNSFTTFNGLENVLGATATPVIDANISTGADEIINIYNGTTIGLLGDVNLDDQVNILDILVMIDHILGRITLYTPLTGQAFTNGDLDNWAAGNLLPSPDGVINVLDLAVLQEIVRTGLYPSGNPVNKAVFNPFNVVNNGLDKLTPGMDAKLTFFLTANGIAVEIESIKKVKGVQMELNDLRSLIPQGSQMTSIFDNALYYQNNGFLRMLSYDGAAEPILPGLFVLSNLPFTLYDPQSIKVEKIIVADENNEAMQKVEIEIRYEGAPGIPLDYSLSQNFPNPFNPNTSVQFTVPVEGFVTIKVYDMLGQAVADLYAGSAQAGTYTLNWNGQDNNGNFVSSGSYIYKMTAGDFVQSKKMTFLK